MIDDYQIDDLPCPKCGNTHTHSSHCSEFDCEDGSVDLYHYDPINESPGTYVTCDTCYGHGIERWCPKCGADYWVAKHEAMKSGAIKTCPSCRGSGNAERDECSECSGSGWVRVTPEGATP